MRSFAGVMFRLLIPAAVLLAVLIGAHKAEAASAAKPAGTTPAACRAATD